MSDHIVEIAKGVPPATVATLSIFGVSIPDYIQYATVFYITCVCIQMIYKGVRWGREWLAKRKDDNDQYGV